MGLCASFGQRYRAGDKAGGEEHNEAQTQNVHLWHPFGLIPHLIDNGGECRSLLGAKIFPFGDGGVNYQFFLVRLVLDGPFGGNVVIFVGIMLACLTEHTEQVLWHLAFGNHLHHLTHLAELIKQLVHVSSSSAAAVGDAPTSPAVDDLRISALFWRH